MKNVVRNILLRVVVAGTETEESKKDLWKMILEVYGALRKCYTSDTYVAIYLNLFINALLYIISYFCYVFYCYAFRERKSSSRLNINVASLLNFVKHYNINNSKKKFSFEND